MLAACRAAVADDPPRISEIELRIGDVFTTEEAAAAFFPYRLANLIHIETRQSFIRRYLLFKVGDPVDLELFAQTERNLRATSLFRFVTIRSEGTRVIVETGDAWTLLLRGSVSRKAGIVEWQAGVQEYNLLGLGRDVRFLYDSGAERISRSFSFADRDFLVPYGNLRLAYSDLSDGRASELRFHRPFYALEALWQGGVSYRQARFEPTVWAGGVEAATWQEFARYARAEAGKRIRFDGTSALRALASVDYSDVILSAGKLGPPPPDGQPPRRFLFFSGGLEHDARHWIERRDAEKIGRVEDFNLAPVGRFEVGLSPAVSGGTAAGRLAVRGGMGTELGTGFALASLAGETRYEDGPRNALVSLDTRAFLQRSRLTLVGRIGVVAGWRLDPEVQIQLDGENGVRAYQLHAVSGTGRAVANVELRLFFFYDVLKLVSFGAAVFGDAGVSWGDPDGWWRLADVGVGLRFGLTRASENALLRLDVARALHPDPLGRTGWLLTFGSSQAF